jgi:hypothetical protein
MDAISNAQTPFQSVDASIDRELASIKKNKIAMVAFCALGMLTCVGLHVSSYFIGRVLTNWSLSEKAFVIVSLWLFPMILGAPGCILISGGFYQDRKNVVGQEKLRHLLSSPSISAEERANLLYKYRKSIFIFSSDGYCDIKRYYMENLIYKLINKNISLESVQGNSSEAVSLKEIIEEFLVDGVGLPYKEELRTAFLSNCKTHPELKELMQSIFPDSNCALN